ncbi:hypothetical protein DPM19_20415 [Actinomadura craniellae]|uniref:Integral membrane protein n=1 Tax=Actinomadura craniellae TaxID=2231787 RepID=A0A365H302_9ACTN|nr:hypothetical protein [Actinomadura craniellae]RAY13429.1 hypothetical protein DPM19_20415 [Actinomadura craniellae]
MSDESRPLSLRGATAIEALEGAAALAFGLFVGWETITGSPVDIMSAIGVTVLALLGAAGMFAVARGLYRMEPWSRAPAVLTQLFALPVAVSLINSDQRGYGVPLLVAAVVALILMLYGRTTDVLVGRPGRDGD